jgi:Rrf2 family protein
MKVSAQEEYGLRCLVCVAQRGADRPSITIPEIAEMEALSTSHVAKLLSVLRRGGYLQSIRGQQGGYVLAMPPEKILVSEVLGLLGGRFFHDRFCERHSGNEEACVHQTDCILRPIWTNVQAAIDRILSQVTLADIIEQRLEAPATQLSAHPSPMLKR